MLLSRTAAAGSGALPPQLISAAAAEEADGRGGYAWIPAAFAACTQARASPLESNRGNLLANTGAQQVCVCTAKMHAQKKVKGGRGSRIRI